MIFMNHFKTAVNQIIFRQFTMNNFFCTYSKLSLKKIQSHTSNIQHSIFCEWGTIQREKYSVVNLWKKLVVNSCNDFRCILQYVKNKPCNSKISFSKFSQFAKIEVKNRFKVIDINFQVSLCFQLLTRVRFPFTLPFVKKISDEESKDGRNF